MSISKVARNSASKKSRKNGVEPALELPDEDCDNSYARIAVCAYYKAEARDFEPGHEMEDWFVAEKEVGQCIQS